MQLVTDLPMNTKCDLRNEGYFLRTFQVAVSGEKCGDGRTSSPCDYYWKLLVHVHHLSHHHFPLRNPFSGRHSTLKRNNTT